MSGMTTAGATVQTILPCSRRMRRQRRGCFLEGVVESKDEVKVVVLVVDRKVIQASQCRVAAIRPDHGIGAYGSLARRTKGSSIRCALHWPSVLEGTGMEPLTQWPSGEVLQRPARFIAPSNAGAVWRQESLAAARRRPSDLARPPQEGGDHDAATGV